MGVWPASLGAELEYWYIKRGLLSTIKEKGFVFRESETFKKSLIVSM